MRYLIRSDKKKRLQYSKRERDNLLLKSIIGNRFLYKPFRQIGNSEFGKVSSTRVVNRCIYTGRGHGIIRRYKMSRMVFKELAGKGMLPGIHKGSW
jgi:ribosomal protein S14